MSNKEYLTRAGKGAVVRVEQIVTKEGAVRRPKNMSLLEIHNLSSQEKIGIIRTGISKKHLSDIKTELELDYDELSEVLGTSRATLINKKKSQTFDTKVSEKIVLLTDVLGYGREIFGDNDNFNEWLKTPSEALGNVTPLSIMDTMYGIEEVKKEIGRIAYGVF